MRAVIMAGGVGSRLAPYTTVLPKPLMPLIDRPILDVLLHQLEHAGVDGVSISVGHLSGLIESWVRHHHDGGMAIDFVHEHEPLGTAGALALVPRPDGPFLALNGDILTTLDFRALAEHNRTTGAIASMAVNERVVDVQYGVVHADGDGKVERLEEKPQLRYTVSMGVYVMRPEIVDLIDPGERVDLPDLMLRAIGRGHDVRTLRFDGYWRDIGNPDDYATAIDDFAADPQRFLRA
jgi:NDP-sugar pyrophosphorylase family protein